MIKNNMKTIYLLAFSFIACIATAQTTKTDAYDILLKLIPNTGKPATWQSAKEATKGLVKWTQPNPTKQIIGYNIIGAAKIDYNNQPIKCNGTACETSISLNGPGNKGYDEIEFNVPPDGLPAVQLEKLFGKKPYKAKILKKELDGVGGLMYYEVQFPGKPLVWIQVSTIPAYREEQSNDFMLTVFFNKKSMMARM